MNHIRNKDIPDLEKWAAVRSRILSAAQEVMGPFPDTDRDRPPLVRVVDEADCGAYLRQHIVYEADAGCETPAFLCTPRTASAETPARAALCLHPTNARDGNRDVVGLTDRTNRSYASELAERGFVTIAPSYPHLADYEPDLEGLGYAGGTMKAIRDNVRALDLLDSLDIVLSTGYAAIGHSLGGHNAVYTAVFDPRLQVVVSNCGLDSFEDYYNWAPGKGWSQHRYMPRIGRYPTPADIPFDFHDLIACLAPRACLVSAPVDDDNFISQSAEAVVEAARSVYRLHDAGDRLRIIHPDCAHDFPPDVREPCYAFIDRMLDT